MKKLVIYALLIVGILAIVEVQEEHRKTLLIPGNKVLYHGTLYEIFMVEINSETDQHTIVLTGLDKKIPGDSVKSAYRPFWRKNFF